VIEYFTKWEKIQPYISDKVNPLLGRSDNDWTVWIWDVLSLLHLHQYDRQNIRKLGWSDLPSVCSFLCPTQ